MADEKPIQIFSNPKKNIGVNVVKSPVKLTILEMLRGSDMEFDEIIDFVKVEKKISDNINQKYIVCYFDIQTSHHLYNTM